MSTNHEVDLVKFENIFLHLMNTMNLYIPIRAESVAITGSCFGKRCVSSARLVLNPGAVSVFNCFC